jgi:alpha-galactosidase
MASLSVIGRTVGVGGAILLLLAGACSRSSQQGIPATAAHLPVVAQPASPLVFQCDGHAFVAARQACVNDDPAFKEILEDIRRAADKDLLDGPYTIVNKQHPLPGIDPHDYVSLAPYFWPSTRSTDGLPYVSRDGKRNPEYLEYDVRPFGEMSEHVYRLALAGYLSGDARYSDRAAVLIRAWFFDPTTRMNPNLDHAQLVPGVNEGRSFGIIESNRLFNVLDAVGLLEVSPNSSWSDDDRTKIRAWFSAYRQWMQTSVNGQAESRAANNHGSWYAAQLTAYSLFVDDPATARQTVEGAKPRVARQIQPDGQEPLELARTRSFEYSSFNLTALTMLADLGRRVGVDLWNFRTEDGRSIRAAINFLVPFATGQRKWEHEELEGFSGAPLFVPLRRAAAAYHEPLYDQVADNLDRDRDRDDVRYPPTFRPPATEPSSSAGEMLEILTPPPPDTPRINGARVYGERPGRPFLFTIPATGSEPITFSADGLPPELTLDSSTGRISGSVASEGDFNVTLTATNALGRDSKPLLIKIGPQICLTPPLGWNSWNCFAGAVDQEKVLAAAMAMSQSGLLKHGWTFINIDDSWQGPRGGKFNAIQGNEKFPDMRKLCDAIHNLGLKAGIYSTPWEQSYAGFIGGSSDYPDGAWTKATGPREKKFQNKPWAVGQYHFMKADARQWADWGFDYLKYDWNPIDTPDVLEMKNALDASGRDLVYSLSNGAPFDNAVDWARYSNLWRTGGDINDTWDNMSAHAFGEQKWANFQGPGHFNDPDMLVVGLVGWGPQLHPTCLSPDEQYTHITQWALLGAPMLIGCDMTRMDAFTFGLLSNDEVLAVNQDALCTQARRIREDLRDGTEIWAKPLADGTIAVGLFNRGRFLLSGPRHGSTTRRLIDRSSDATQEFDTTDAADAALQKTAAVRDITVTWADLNLSGPQPVRDLWRQIDLPDADGSFTATVAFHGAAMFRIGNPQK